MKWIVVIYKRLGSDKRGEPSTKSTAEEKFSALDFNVRQLKNVSSLNFFNYKQKIIPFS